MLTLALVSLMLLLLLGLAAMIRLEQQVGINSNELGQARANARLGLRAAIGQLQRHVGGGGIVTARADVAGGTWANPAWTGVWGAGDGAGAVTWLVSGNENLPLSITPEMAMSGSSDLFLLRRNLTATEQVKVRKVNIESIYPGESSPSVIGSYAYWVSDESLKLSMNVRSDVTPPSGFSRYPVPRLDAMFPTFAATDDARSKLLATDQLLLVGLNASTLNARWPEVTASAPRLYFPTVGGGELIPGSFNANSRSERAWNAYLGGLTVSASNAAMVQAILNAPRPFRSVTDLQTKLTAIPAIGATNAAALVDGLSPVLGVHGDTYLIRAYGEAVNRGRDVSDADYISAAAYCEALVQRTPDQAAGFGYRFVVVYFRWLAADDI